MSEHDESAIVQQPRAPGPPLHMNLKPKPENVVQATWVYGGADMHNDTRLQWSKDDYVPVGRADIVGLRFFDIVGLEPATRYIIESWGLKDGEVSASSLLAYVTTDPAEVVPGAPTDVVAISGNRLVSLTWSPTPNASSYKVSHGLAPSGSVIATKTVDQPHAEVTGLAPDTRYYFNVFAVNNVGDSVPTQVIQATLQVPAVPGDLQAVAEIITIALQWSASNGATGYVIRYGEEPGGTPTVIHTSSLGHTLAKLTKDTLYYVEVTAENHNGESLPSRITIRTKDGPPLPGRPSDLVLVDNAGAVRAGWAGTTLKYEVAYGLVADYPQIVEAYETEFKVFDVLDPPPFSEIFITVRAMNESGYSPPVFRQFTTGPDRTQPRNARSAGRTDREVWLRWARPINYHGLIGYEVSCEGLPTYQTTEVEFIVSGLEIDTEYEFTIQPLRRPGFRTAVPAFASTLLRDVVPPTLPQHLKFKVLGPGTAQVSWSRSGDNIEVAGYEVRRSRGDWVEVQDNFYTVDDWAEGNTDIFEVRAFDGARNYSLIARERPRLKMVGDVPGAPTNYRVKTGAVPRIDWDRPSGTVPLDGYRITLSDSFGTVLPFTTVSEHLLPIINPLVRYTVKVAAYNEHGRSADLIGEIPPLGQKAP